MDLGDDVGAADLEAHRARHPERDMQYRAVFGDVDVRAGEHPGPVFGQPALVREGDQVPQGLVGDALLGVIELETGAVGAQSRAAVGIGPEQLAQMHAVRCAPVGIERVPGGVAARAVGGAAGVIGHRRGP